MSKIAFMHVSFALSVPDNFSLQKEVDIDSIRLGFMEKMKKDLRIITVIFYTKQVARFIVK